MEDNLKLLRPEKQRSHLAVQIARSRGELCFFYEEDAEKGTILRLIAEKNDEL